MAKGMWMGIGKSMTNLLASGNFANTTYWTADDATYTVSDNIANTVNSSSSSTWSNLFRKVNTTSGHIYYASVQVRYTTSVSSHYGARLSFKDGNNISGSSLVYNRATKFDNTWNQLSIRYTANVSSLGVCLFLPYTGSGVPLDGTHVYWQQPILIDLTAMYGSGKEPTKEWCDANLTYGNLSSQVGAGVARSIKDLWIGIDSVGYRLLVNVSQGEKINIGGNLFTVVSHGKGADGFANETLLWSDTPTGQAKWTDIFEWGKSTGVDSAFNTTITNMAIKKSNGYKFYVLTGERDLSGLSGIRYSNGTAVNHWMSDTGVGSTLVEEVTGNPGGWVGVSKYRYGPYYFYYWNTSGTKKTISCGGPGDEDIDPVYPGSTYYYFYACKISGDTKVIYDSVNGYYKLYT